MNEILKKAEEIARKGHSGQYRKDGKQYITHPEAIVNTLQDVDMKIIGWLHDIIEDTEYTPEMLIKEGIPANLVKIIVILSRKKDETYVDFIMRIKKDRIATIIKIEDIKHNLSTLKECSLKDKYRFARQILEGENE